MGKRYIGLDFGRGIAILGVILAHSFEGRVTHWDSAVLFNLASQIPIVLLIILFVPIVVGSTLGSLFSFITAIGVTISSLRIRQKGLRYVFKYIIVKVIFALLLKGLEDFWVTVLKFPFFQNEYLEIPRVHLRYWAHSLDNVGCYSWLIPLVVLGITSIPRLKYKYQVAILTVISFLLLWYNNITVQLFATLGDWFKSKEFYFFYYLCSKVADGAFAIGQYVPFGLMGGAYGILFHNTQSFKEYWSYTIVVVILYLALGLPFVASEEDFFSRIFGWIKPTPFLFIVGAIQTLAMMICLQLNDNPNRSVKKRYLLIKNSTFLRRANCMSLTAYIVEESFSEFLYTVFRVFFGPGADLDNHVCLWPWYLVLFYVLVVTLLWVLLIRVWERFEFRFSMEHQLGCIMGWLFQTPYNRVDYKSTIYAPLNTVREELDRELAKENGEAVATGGEEVVEVAQNTEASKEIEMKHVSSVC